MNDGLFSCWLLAIAFQTDLTRVVSFSTGNEGTGPAVPEIGVKQDRHSLSHHNGNPKLLQDLRDSDAFNIKQFGYFLDRLSEAKTRAGSAVLTFTPVPEAYTSRHIRVEYQSAENKIAGALLWTAVLSGTSGPTVC